jgi:pimeloyl-[acyl-carrier protein] methyl ester esterase
MSQHEHARQELQRMGIHLCEHGSHGPRILLLHGWAMHGGVFDPLLERLLEGHRLVQIDLPGHGRSAASRVALGDVEWMQQLASAYPRSLLLGWSLGGLLALRAHAQTQAFAGLILLAASPCFTQQANWPHAVRMSLFERFAEELEREYRGTLERFLALEVTGDEHAMSALRQLKAQLFVHGEPSKRALHEGLHLLEHCDERPGLAALQVPSLWLAGARDRLVPATGMQAAAALCQGEFQCIDRAGHAPFLTHTQEVAMRIGAFAQKTGCIDGA